MKDRNQLLLRWRAQRRVFDGGHDLNCAATRLTRLNIHIENALAPLGPRHRGTASSAGSGPSRCLYVTGVSRTRQVVLRIASDFAADCHVHGEQLERRLKLGQTTEMRLTTNLTGRFDFELHAAFATREVGALEVYPAGALPEPGS